jgi:ferredoxin
MAYQISEDCVKCSACELECPNQAIREEENQYVIDPNRCSECVGAYPSSKCAEMCAVDAPQPDPAHRKTKEALMKIWQELHPNESPVM